MQNVFAQALDMLDAALLDMQNANSFEELNLDSDSVSDFHYLARTCENYLECYRNMMGDGKEEHI